jgi:RHS repeat-associated protein
MRVQSRQIHGDYTVSMSGQTPVIEDATAHVPGLGQCDVMLPPSAEGAMYVHGNLVGTNERMTDSGAAVVRSAVYTAFGEPVCGSGGAGTCGTGVPPVGRYGYAGAWGYQSSDDSNDPLAALGWLHVGERYYDPASGRFVQRDPIGLAGGVNVYVYVGNNPVIFIDPNGLMWQWVEDLYQKLPEGFHEFVGGGGHIPVLDPGTAQDVVQKTADIVSIAAPCGAVGRAITMGPKALRAAKEGGRITRALLRVRKYIRYDRHPPHAGSPHPWDGDLIRWFLD